MEDLKSALKTLISVAENTESALADDNHIDFVEGTKIGISALGLIKVVKNLKKIIADYKNLTAAQIAELSEWFKKEFDIVNDKAEVIVEKVFVSLLNLGDAFELLFENK